MLTVVLKRFLKGGTGRFRFGEVFLELRKISNNGLIPMNSKCVFRRFANRSFRLFSDNFRGWLRFGVSTGNQSSQRYHKHCESLGPKAWHAVLPFLATGCIVALIAVAGVRHTTGRKGRALWVHVRRGRVSGGVAPIEHGAPGYSCGKCAPWKSWSTPPKAILWGPFQCRNEAAATIRESGTGE